MSTLGPDVSGVASTFDVVGNIFAAIDKWLAESGCPFTDDQRAVIAGALRRDEAAS